VVEERERRYHRTIKTPDPPTPEGVEAPVFEPFRFVR
jgi:hypothetical protein